MSPMQGANADELDRLAGELNDSAKLVGGCQVQLTREIHASPWAGRSAEAFKRRWDSEFRRSLIEANAFLIEAGDVLRLNADQQRQASGTGQGAWTPVFDFEFGGFFGDPGFPDDWWDPDWGAIFGALYDGVTTVMDIATVLGFELLPQFAGTVVGFVTGGISMWQGMDDLLAFEYDGWLGVVDTVGDGMQVISGGLAIAGTWMLIPPATPGGAIVLGVAAGLGLVSTGINYAIEYREEIGAAWDAGTEWAGNTWDSASDWAGDTWDSAGDVVGDGWDTASDWAGSAWNAVF